MFPSCASTFSPSFEKTYQYVGVHADISNTNDLIEGCRGILGSAVDPKLNISWENVLKNVLNQYVDVLKENTRLHKQRNALLKEEKKRREAYEGERKKVMAITKDILEGDEEKERELEKILKNDTPDKSGMNKLKKVEQAVARFTAKRSYQIIQLKEDERRLCMVLLPFVFSKYVRGIFNILNQNIQKCSGKNWRFFLPLSQKKHIF